jgi:hypothetical protein
MASLSNNLYVNGFASAKSDSEVAAGLRSITGSQNVSCQEMSAID